MYEYASQAQSIICPMQTTLAITNKYCYQLRIMQSYVHVDIIERVTVEGMSLQELAVALLLLLDAAGVGGLSRRSSLGWELLLIALVICNDRVDCFAEDILNSSHLLAAAFHVTGSHLPGNGHALLLSDWSQALGLEKINACSLCSEVGLETNEDERSVGAKVKDFRVPLFKAR